MLSNPFDTIRVAASVPFFGFDKAVAVVHDRFNWNHFEWGDLIPFTHSETTTVSEVERVLQCYVELCKQGKVPEFTRAVPKQVWVMALGEVASCSGAQAERVYYLLVELHDATLDGTIESSEWLHPLTYKQASVNQVAPAGSSKNAFDGALGAFASLVKVGLVAAGLYLGIQFWQEIDE